MKIELDLSKFAQADMESALHSAAEMLEKEVEWLEEHEDQKGKAKAMQHLCNHLDEALSLLMGPNQEPEASD